MDYVGFFAIITSEKMDPVQALEIYRERDAIEKVFRMEKSYVGNDIFKAYPQVSLEGKMFISFIALIIRNAMKCMMKELYENNRTEYSISQVLSELDRMGIIKLSDDKYHIRFTLSNKQNKILNALNSNEKEYQAYANEVINFLGKK